MTAYMIVGKSGIIDVIPLSVSSRLLLVISLPNVSKLTFLHEVPAISNSVPVVSWILFLQVKSALYIGTGFFFTVAHGTQECKAVICEMIGYKLIKPSSVLIQN